MDVRAVLSGCVRGCAGWMCEGCAGGCVGAVLCGCVRGCAGWIFEGCAGGCVHEGCVGDCVPCPVLLSRSVCTLERQSSCPLRRAVLSGCVRWTVIILLSSEKGCVEWMCEVDRDNPLVL